MISKKVWIWAGLSVVLALGITAYYLYFQKFTTPSGVTESNNPPAAAPLNQTYSPATEELTAKTAGWQTYESKDYKFKIKYPLGWSYWDRKTPGAVLGQTIYSAVEILRVGGPVGVMSVSYSEDVSKMPTEGSLIQHFKQDYNWSTTPQFKFFSALNGFECAVGTVEDSIGTVEDSKGRGQIASAFRRVNNEVFYLDWYLNEDYQLSRSSYPDVTYQNQFLPFLASFEVID